MKTVIQAIVRYIKNADKLLWLLCFMCSAFSMVLMYSLYVNGFISSSRNLIIQLVGILLGIVAAIILSLIDYDIIAKLWKIHLPLTVFLVLLTFFFGVQRGGADDKAWLDLGITTIQPAEFLKLSFIVTFALHLSSLKEELNRPKNILLLALHAGAITGLIVVQGDFGTALIFLFIAICMVLSAGLSWKYILTGIIALPVIGFLVWEFVFQDLHRNRVLIAFNPDLDPKGEGYQQVQGRMALGSGGMFGRGLFSDNLVKVPEMHNDFIFSYIGQTLGFVGCLAVILLLAAICIRIVLVANLSKDKLGQLICIGVFAFVLFQTMVNIGMVLCVAPVIGVTLPFFSSGGSSVLTMYVSMGLVFSVYMKNHKRMMFD